MVVCVCACVYAVRLCGVSWIDFMLNWAANLQVLGFSFPIYVVNAQRKKLDDLHSISITYVGL